MGHLRSFDSDQDTFCALGVLTDVIAPNSWRLLTNPLFGKTRYNQPLELDDVPLTADQCHQLISMNDDQGRTFEQIADWIEENL